MKEDAPAPLRPPVKRRALERAPDYWLAVWAADEALSDPERARVQEERDRRKAARPDRIVGVLVDIEDVTPEQLDRLREHLVKARPTAIHHPWATRRISGMCRAVGKQLGIQVSYHEEIREVVLASQMLIAAPRKAAQIGASTPAWDAIRFSRHRRLPVTIILPNGTIEGEA